MNTDPRPTVWKRRERSTGELMGLAICDLFRFPLSALGVDYRTFRLLVELRFVLGLRRKAAEGLRNTFFDGGLLITCGLAALIGTAFGFLVVSTDSPGTVALALSLLMIFYGATLTISIFADLLFDAPTAAFLAGRPVDDKTAFAARVVPASVSVMLVQSCLAIPMIVMAAIRFGGRAPALALTATALLNAVLATSIVLVAFALILRFSTAERFKSLVVKAQLALTIVLFLGPQVPHFLPRSAPHDPTTFAFDGAWRILPAVWYRELVDGLTGEKFERGVLVPLLAVVVPFLLLAVSFALVRGKFVAALAGGGAEPERSRRSRSLLDAFAPSLAPTPAERAGYGIATALQVRERGSMLQTMPQLLYSFVIPVGIIGPGSDGFAERIGLFSHGLPLGVLMVVAVLSRTDDPNAVWVYRMAPCGDLSRVYAGAVRATLIRFVLLPIAVLTIVATILGGATGAVNALVAGAIAWCFAALGARAIGGGLPFSRKFDKTAATGMTGLYFGFLLLTLGSTIAHRFLLDRVEFAIPVGILFAFLGARRFAALRDRRIPDPSAIVPLPEREPASA